MKESIKLIVPSGIRYISQWNEFKLEQFPHILDKQIPGCGFTEWCITNSDNVILCSPRKILLENKEEQHSGEVFRVINEYERDLNVDKDLESKNKRPDPDEPDFTTYLRSLVNTPKTVTDRISQELFNYIQSRKSQNLPIKILVTYDSFRIIKYILQSNNIFQDFQVIIDEFQSIFTDSRFKSGTELDFVNQLQGVQRVCYVSATPMMREYLDLLDEFKDLPFYELDWRSAQENRVIKPNLHPRVISGITTQAREIIQTYLDGNFERAIRTDNNGNTIEIFSKEAIFYVNSVNHITRIINAIKLTPDQCNILVSKTPENIKKIKKRLGRKWSIGKVPLRNEPRKMFTFCTRTVYLGADFYSDNARSFIFSDANIKTLAVDISLDLPQILGRQRLLENPWKNEAWFYYKTLTDRSKKKLNQNIMEAEVKDKLVRTEKLLSAYTTALDDSRVELASVYEKMARAFNYEDDYVAVNRHLDGSSPIPVINRLVIVAEKRAFDIQKFDYADRFVMFNQLSNITNTSKLTKEVTDFFINYKDCKNNLTKKLRLFCGMNLSEEARERIVSMVDEKTRTYYNLGLDVIRASGYSIARLDKQISNKLVNQTNLVSSIYQEFKEGEKTSKIELKTKLQKIYDLLGSKQTAKASDLEKYFELKSCKVKNSQTGKWENGFELVKKK